MEKDAQIMAQAEAITRLETQQADFEARLTALESSIHHCDCYSSQPLWNNLGGKQLEWISIGLFSFGVSYLAGRRRMA
jgi:hypothetical protein